MLRAIPCMHPLSLDAARQSDVRHSRSSANSIQLSAPEQETYDRFIQATPDLLIHPAKLAYFPEATAIIPCDWRN